MLFEKGQNGTKQTDQHLPAPDHTVRRTLGQNGTKQTDRDLPAAYHTFGHTLGQNGTKQTDRDLPAAYHTFGRTLGEPISAVITEERLLAWKRLETFTSQYVDILECVQVLMTGECVLSNMRRMTLRDNRLFESIMVWMPQWHTHAQDELARLNTERAIFAKTVQRIRYAETEVANEVDSAIVKARFMEKEISTWAIRQFQVFQPWSDDASTAPLHIAFVCAALISDLIALIGDSREPNQRQHQHRTTAAGLHLAKSRVPIHKSLPPFKQSVHKAFEFLKFAIQSQRDGSFQASDVLLSTLNDDAESVCMTDRRDAIINISNACDRAEQHVHVVTECVIAKLSILHVDSW
jgi:hypothetical protein